MAISKDTIIELPEGWSKWDDDMKLKYLDEFEETRKDKDDKSE